MSKNNGSWITDCLYLLLVVAAITFFSSAFLYLLCRLQIGDFFELTESQKTDKVLSIEGRTNDREVLPQGNFSISKVDGGFLKGMSYILTGKLNNGGKMLGCSL